MDVEKIIAIGIVAFANILVVGSFIAITIQTEQGNAHTNICYETLKGMTAGDLRITCGVIK